MLEFGAHAALDEDGYELADGDVVEVLELSANSNPERVTGGRAEATGQSVRHVVDVVGPIATGCKSGHEFLDPSGSVNGRAADPMGIRRPVALR